MSENIKNEKEEVKKPKGNEQLKRGLIIIGAVGVGAGLYGFNLGVKLGHRVGTRQGYMQASIALAEALNVFAEEVKTKSKEGK